MKHVVMVASLLTVGAGALSAQGMVSGRVFDDSTSCPLRGARITAQGSSATTLTDAQGRYYLKGVPTTAFNLEVMLRGYASATETNVLAVDPETRVDFSLVRAPTDGKPAVKYPPVHCVLDRRDSLEVKRNR